MGELLRRKGGEKKIFVVVDFRMEENLYRLRRLFFLISFGEFEGGGWISDRVQCLVLQKYWFSLNVNTEWKLMQFGRCYIEINVAY